MKRALIFIIPLIAIAVAQKCNSSKCSVNTTIITPTHRPILKPAENLTYVAAASNSTKTISPPPAVKILPDTQIHKNHSNVNMSYKVSNVSLNASVSTSKVLNVSHVSQVRINYNNISVSHNKSGVNNSVKLLPKTNATVVTMNLSAPSRNVSLNLTYFPSPPSNFTVNKPNVSIWKNTSKAMPSSTINHTNSSISKNVSRNVQSLTVNTTNFSIKRNHSHKINNSFTLNRTNSSIQVNASPASNNSIKITFNKTQVLLVKNHSAIYLNLSNVSANSPWVFTLSNLSNSSFTKPTAGIRSNNHSINNTVLSTKNASGVPLPKSNKKYSGFNFTVKFTPPSVYSENSIGFIDQDTNKSKTLHKKSSSFNFSPIYNKSKSSKGQVYYPQASKTSNKIQYTHQSVSRHQNYQNHSGFHRWTSFLWSFYGFVIVALLIASCCVLCRRAKTLRHHHRRHHHVESNDPRSNHPHHHHLPPHLHHHHHRLSAHKLQKLQAKYGINFGLPQPINQAPFTNYSPQDSTNFTQFDNQADTSTQNLVQPSEFYQEESMNNSSLAREVPMAFNPQVAGYYPVNLPHFQAGPMPVQILPQSHPQYFVYPMQFQQMPQNTAPFYYAPTAHPVNPRYANTIPNPYTTDVRPPRKQINLEL